MLTGIASGLGWLLNSTVGRIVIGVVAFFIWLHFHDAKIAGRATAACNAEHARLAAVEKARQDEAIFQASVDAEKRQAAEDQRLAKMIREAGAPNEEREKTSRITCGVPDAAVRRMRNIK